MKYIFCFFIIFFSIIYARTDCFQYSEKNSLGRSIRPVKDIYSISPSGHFYIHYDTTGSAAPNLVDIDLNGIPDYIDEVGIIADSANYVLVDIMGWKEEPSDDEGGYDIYIMNYAAGVYGYNYPDINNTSYLQIDNDYLGYSTKFDLTPLQIMRITVAHEYFHGIQWGYEENLGNNAYFYELTSMWFEDILIPDGNDYLDGWTDRLFNNPMLPFNATSSNRKGYELALFGHYLSSFIDQKGAISPKNSTILREIWEYYSSHSSSNAFNAVKHILDQNYNYSFSEIWIDFLSRNLFNGIYSNMDNKFYYYIDQSIADPLISTSKLVTLNYDNNEVSLFSNASTILSFYSEENSFLNFVTSSDDYHIKLAKISSSGDNILLDSLQSNIALYGKPDADDLHLFLSKDNEITTLDINIDYSIAETLPPWPPTNIALTQNYHKISIAWKQSPGPGSNLIYDIYRFSNTDTLLLGTTQSLNYEDFNRFIIDEEYSYFITCRNEFEESIASTPQQIIYRANFPEPPSNLNVITFQDSILLNWNHSNGPGDSLYYNIYKNNVFYDSTIDSLYIDNDINTSTNYSYSISSLNDEGESRLTPNISVISWPKLDSSYVNEFISVYPNPLISSYELSILFSLEEKDAPIINLIDINGKVIHRVKMQEYLKGYHRKKINFSKSKNISSGIYFISINFKNNYSLNKKIIFIN